MSEGRRTQAVRAPGAGGFTPATSAAASNPCLNCGTNIQLEFCPECGQREIDTDPTVKDYAREVGADLVQKEGKVARTFRALVMRPGELTSEYHDGRRVRYVTPIRLFLACGAIFLAARAAWPARLLGESRLLNRVPFALFVLAPVLGTLVGYLYRDRRRHYPQHLVFSLHLHSAAFLALSLALFSAAIPVAVVRNVIEVLVLTSVAVYGVRAAKLVYNSSMAQAVSRTLIALALYAALIAGVVSI